MSTFTITDSNEVYASKYKWVLIGDPHFRTDNAEHIDTFISQVEQTCILHQVQAVAVMGDLLHYHERVNTCSLNKAYTLVQTLRKHVPVYVIVGNHDYINNSQFLSDQHWMNAMKEWSNVYIVDKGYNVCTPYGDIVMCPYVFPGRFEEALSTFHTNWRHAKLILAHQEIYGCKMGALQSTDGDKWDADYPMVCSGHIHDRQLVQPNVFYVGSAMQHAFGESADKSISIVHLDVDQIQNVRLALPKKKTYYIDASTLLSSKNSKELNLDHDAYDKIRITLQGSAEEFKVVKKSKAYKELCADNVKVVFRTTEIVAPIEAERTSETQFATILYKSLETTSPHLHAELYRLYKMLVH